MNENIHPRPQLARGQWLDLNGPWDFAYDDQNEGLDKCWQLREDIYNKTIQVPFPPESQASGIADTGYHPYLWYRRTLNLPAAYNGKRLILHFGAVDYSAQIWVNGQLVATHEGGHTPFSADITSVIQKEGKQTIVVRAEDQPKDLAQPRGKQDWLEQTHDIWYKRTSGIWQQVWLEPVSQDYITNVRWTPNLSQNTLTQEITIQSHTKTPLRVRTQLFLRGELLLDDTYLLQGQTLKRDLSLAFANIERGDLLWSPEHPNLLDATITLLEDDKIVDQVQSYAGIRGIGTQNGRFLLNGHPYYLRLVLQQGYWPQSHLASPSQEALRREAELVKELGFNGVRIHQKIEDPRFLCWCDRLGIIVWGEIANAYTFTRESQLRLTHEWLEAVERDYSHPCIVAWVPINESWGVPNLLNDPAQRHFSQGLYHLTRALDPTRPVMGNEGWEHVESDILGIHDYAFFGETLQKRYGDEEAIDNTFASDQPGNRVLLFANERNSDAPIMLTEFGGISYRPQEGEAWYGYGTVTTREAYLAKYRELINSVLTSPAIAGFCYTQFTDTEQERNGLLTEQRESKFDISTIKQINQQPAAQLSGDAPIRLRENQ
ncbi:glycoside hydrolase family 2 protein [Ktedonospora formicarum]|uniref:Beta-galactosidase n=1 Tax=Ktedonospora formicarum TaxID=2778364 RepID=A0A8J3MVJ6_9CHLR|nr:sugar-binding domain-containing protein [Ktedonospora formicarum]GHO46580.1 beta-galactosidase [Ktedonospora formicarum]